ncbi:hypothetical protein VIBNISOn1_p0082 [Vibrio nigripulchritudo SOn1]|uniref:Uncharacterized protein n=1 Tax=Vibrio nigripulchritudo SOn1 TaxID=1238450 RepID=A0AAV2VZQ1_9VIBR|nr:hypothetical protein VIBNISOn1_p0082 [Vibrio nigripulchritudo SOn1]
MAEKQGLHRRFQANTIKEQQVLSYLNLGLRIYQKPLLRISIDVWRNMIGKILDDLSNNQRDTVGVRWAPSVPVPERVKFILNNV